MAIITGTPGDDLLLGTAGDDTISGLAGHDYLRGEEGDDQLSGGDGDDYLRGGAGNDRLDGGAGWDRAAFRDAAAGVHVDLNIQGTAQDTLQGLDVLVGIEHASGTIYADTLIGDAGDNWLWGEGGADIFSAGDGNDLVEIGSGNVTADGGAGADGFSVWNNAQVYASPVSISLLLQGGAQDGGLGILTLSGFENLSGSAGDDTLEGDGNGNVLAGDTGADRLDGGDGDDVLYGDGRITIDTHDTGTSGPITTYADVVAALPDAGLVGGDDTLLGGSGNDALWGGGGHDFLSGDSGDDALHGGDGDDYLRGGAGNDLVEGGAGWDRAAFRDATSGVHVDLNIQGIAQDTLQGLDTLTGIEHASGSTFADVLIGNAGDNWLWGEGGADNISAGAGNDLVELGAGNATADGGAGTDTLSFLDQAFGTSGATASLALQGTAQATGVGTMTFTGFENLSGTTFNDILTGNGAGNVLAGDQGNDSLSGGDGDDILYGDGRITVDTHGAGTSGPITTYGDVDAAGVSDPAPGDGDDSLSGGKGNDILVGGGGGDVLTGGAGADTFSFGDGSGDDRITDFAKKDVIAFTGASGPHAFSDLVFAAAGKDTLISWGGGDSILVEGMKPKQLSASDFSFAPAPAAATFALAADLHDAGHHAAAWMP
jgi:Ca2+-binding RTX toxin-like protein